MPAAFHPLERARRRTKTKRRSVAGRSSVAGVALIRRKKAAAYGTPAAQSAGRGAPLDRCAEIRVTVTAAPARLASFPAHPAALNLSKALSPRFSLAFLCATSSLPLALRVFFSIVSPSRYRHR